MSLTTISSVDLAAVSGGAAQTFDQFAASERERVAPAYKGIVCTGAGVKGGGQLAEGLYGSSATDAEKIRGAEALKGLCMAGTRLPSAAPKTPF